MFLHNYRYQIRILLRDRENVFWTMLFPIILGTMFYFAFGNLSNSLSEFDTISIGVVANEQDLVTINSFLEELTQESLTEADEKPLLSVKTTDPTDADRMLLDDEIIGILAYQDQTLSLQIHAANKNASLEQSILLSIVKEYNTMASAFETIATTHPEAIPNAMASLDTRSIVNTQRSYTKGNTDVFTQYFYNLIAMVSLYAALAGLRVATNNQANISLIGARKNITKAPKYLNVLADLLATITIQFFSILLTLFFITFVLRVELGGNIFLQILTALVGSICGSNLGFFIGSIGTASENAKTGIVIAVSMTLCFFSGLMSEYIYIMVDEYFPLLHRISPASLMSDCFYSLNLYDTYTRYTNNMITLLLLSLLFCAGGLWFVRRTSYASI